MKCVGKIAIWLAGGLLLSAGARADNIVVAAGDNPYMAIVARNIFGLNPVQADEPVGDPPPKITLTGIMSTCGKLEALFKVAGTGKPGEPAKDQSYILSEGQREDDIEVTHINEQAGLVTFNNHGTVQEILLASTPGSTMSGPGHGGPVSKGNLARPTGSPTGGNGGNGGNGAANIIPGRGGAGRQNRGMGNDASQNPSTTGGAVPGGGLNVQSLLSTPTRAGNNADQQQTDENALTPEESATLIEAQRELYKSQNNPIHGILPVTIFTPPDATGPTGNPLVMPTAPPPGPGAHSK
jgi:hypothetical protein